MTLRARLGGSLCDVTRRGPEKLGLRVASTRRLIYRLFAQWIENVGCLGPQLFPGREDSTAAGPDVPNVSNPREPTVSIHYALTLFYRICLTGAI